MGALFVDPVIAGSASVTWQGIESWLTISVNIIASFKVIVSMAYKNKEYRHEVSHLLAIQNSGDTLFREVTRVDLTYGGGKIVGFINRLCRGRISSPKQKPPPWDSSSNYYVQRCIFLLYSRARISII